MGIIGNGSGNNAKDPEAFARDPYRITDVTTSNRRFVRCIYYTIPGCLRMSSGKHVAITGSVCRNILKKIPGLLKISAGSHLNDSNVHILITLGIRIKIENWPFLARSVMFLKSRRKEFFESLPGFFKSRRKGFFQYKIDSVAFFSDLSLVFYENS